MEKLKEEIIKEEKLNVCLRCEYRWYPIVENPKTCLFCKSYFWNKPFIRKKITKKKSNSKKDLKYLDSLFENGELR